MAAIQVLTGPERRRRWSEGQKRAIVAAAFAPGAVVTAVARRADVCAGQIYRWRQELRPAATEFAEVIVTRELPGLDGGSSPRGTGAGGAGTADAAALELSFGDQVHVRIPPLTPPALAAAVVAALAAGR